MSLVVVDASIIGSALLLSADLRLVRSAERYCRVIAVEWPER